MYRWYNENHMHSFGYFSELPLIELKVLNILFDEVTEDITKPLILYLLCKSG
jgi:hypothetical protein